MIDYIREYGVTNIDFEYIMHNLKSDVIELMALSEYSIREVLAYYNSIGITDGLSKIIINRPDLILIPKKSIEELVSNIEIPLFVKLVENSIEDLILFGI